MRRMNTSKLVYASHKFGALERCLRWIRKLSRDFYYGLHYFTLTAWVWGIDSPWLRPWERSFMDEVEGQAHWASAIGVRMHLRDWWVLSFHGGRTLHFMTMTAMWSHEPDRVSHNAKKKKKRERKRLHGAPCRVFVICILLLFTWLGDGGLTLL